MGTLEKDLTLAIARKLRSAIANFTTTPAYVQFLRFQTMRESR